MSTGPSSPEADWSAQPSPQPPSPGTNAGGPADALMIDPTQCSKAALLSTIAAIQQELERRSRPQLEEPLGQRRRTAPGPPPEPTVPAPSPDTVLPDAQAPDDTVPASTPARIPLPLTPSAPPPPPPGHSA